MTDQQLESHRVPGSLQSENDQLLEDQGPGVQEIWKYYEGVEAVYVAVSGNLEEVSPSVDFTAANSTSVR